MLFQPLAAVELTATQAQVALNHDNGSTTASEGMEKNDRWTYNGEWYNRLPFIEKNATALQDGAFNRVYEISTAMATKLGANWPNWVFSDMMHHSALVPQLLHFALAHNRPSPPW